MRYSILDREINLGSDVRQKYSPFVRPDIQVYNLDSIFKIVKYFVCILQIIPKIFLGLLLGCFVLLMCVLSLAFPQILDFTLKIGTSEMLWLCGLNEVEFKKTKIDYTEYLGANWKAEWAGASTIVSNHQSYFDTITFMSMYLPSFVTDPSTKGIPFID